ncbi:HdeD family acid-resistance protein [Mesorhizobium sp. BAC0120]|uniref:HdeD family acid-resistance protein n=1 Tax=Mesorhizobium sp. BAC0120 TaxID=3090670 RepID=UPI00298CF0B5|nr:HdeD family acid-resistance protein [Mesorhizobium sp. BAC0120]MDW6024090.1 HdeD family acid-resistance protein [Mesorhizobium sp. BAC0120]
MATTSEHPADRPRGLGVISELRSKWGWFVALGILMLIAGLLAMLNLFLATVVSVFYVGALMLIAGAFQVIHAFGVASWGRFAWWLFSGILYALAGIFAFMNPILASAVLTLLLAAALVAAGVIRIWIGFEHRPEANWGWMVAAGVVTTLVGVIIALGWPVNSLFVLGIFLAIDLLFQGATLTTLGFALKR